MKRLCVFYKDADKWLGRKVNWIVCQQCQRKLRRGEWLKHGLARDRTPAEEIAAAFRVPPRLIWDHSHTPVNVQAEYYVGQLRLLEPAFRKLSRLLARKLKRRIRQAMAAPMVKPCAK